MAMRALSLEIARARTVRRAHGATRRLLLRVGPLVPGRVGAATPAKACKPTKLVTESTELLEQLVEQLVSADPVA